MHLDRCLAVLHGGCCCVKSTGDSKKPSWRKRARCLHKRLPYHIRCRKNPGIHVWYLYAWFVALRNLHPPNPQAIQPPTPKQSTTRSLRKTPIPCIHTSSNNSVPRPTPESIPYHKQSRRNKKQKSARSSPSRTQSTSPSRATQPIHTTNGCDVIYSMLGFRIEEYIYIYIYINMERKGGRREVREGEREGREVRTCLYKLLFT